MDEVVAFDTLHSKAINDCVLDYYAKRLATCSSDNSVKVFDVSSLSTSFCIAELRDHSAAVWKVCWSHPKYGGLLASCSYDKSIIVYKEIEANKYGKIYVNAEHKGSINSIEWAPYELGLHLGCASSDGFISIVSYNLNKDSNTEGCWHRHSVKAHLNGASCISWEKKSNAFSSESNLNEATDQFNSFKLVSGGFDNQVIVWLFDNNSKEFHKLFQMRDDPHKSAVKDVSWKTNVNNTANIIASCSDQQVILWEEDTNTNVWLNKQVITFQNKIDKITWSPNGTILAISCENDNVFLYKENIDGVWTNLCNLGNNNIDLLSNDLNASLKDMSGTGFDNTNEFTQRGKDMNEHNPCVQPYSQVPIHMNQSIGANIAEMPNISYSDEQHSLHMKLNPMEAPRDNRYTQPGHKNLSDVNKEDMVNNTAVNLNRPFSNNEPVNALDRNPSYMYMNKNVNKTHGGPIANENVISREQYRTNNFINPSMNNTFKNPMTQANDSVPLLSPNQYGRDQSQQNTGMPNIPVPATSSISNFSISKPIDGAVAPPQQMQNISYPPPMPSAFTSQQIPLSGSSPITNPNTNYGAPPSQQTANLNRPSIISSMHPPLKSSPPPSNLHISNMNNAIPNKDPLTSTSMATASVPRQQQQQQQQQQPSPFSNVHPGLSTNTGSGGSSYPGKVTAPPYISSQQPIASTATANMNTTSHSDYTTFNVNKGGMPPPAKNTAFISADGNMLGAHPTQPPLSNTSSMMNKFKQMQCPPPPAPQTNGPRAQYVRSPYGENAGMADDLKPYSNPHEYKNFSVPQPSNRHMS